MKRYITVALVASALIGTPMTANALFGRGGGGYTPPPPPPVTYYHNTTLAECVGAASNNNRTCTSTRANTRNVTAASVVGNTNRGISNTNRITVLENAQTVVDHPTTLLLEQAQNRKAQDNKEGIESANRYISNVSRSAATDRGRIRTDFYKDQSRQDDALKAEASARVTEDQKLGQKVEDYYYDSVAHANREAAGQANLVKKHSDAADAAQDKKFAVDQARQDKTFAEDQARQDTIIGSNRLMVQRLDPTVKNLGSRQRLHSVQISSNSTRIGRNEKVVNSLRGGLGNERDERIAGDRAVAGLITDEAAAREAGDARLGAALNNEARARTAGDARLGAALESETNTRIANDRAVATYAKGLVDEEAGARVKGDRAVASYAEGLTEAEEIARIEADLAEAAARYKADLAEAKARITAIAAEKAEREAANAAQDKAVAQDQARQDAYITHNYNTNIRQDDEIMYNYNTNVRQDAAIAGNTSRIEGLENDVRGLEGGVALGIAAASHHYDGSHRGVQASLSAGYYEGASAMSIGMGGNIGKRTFLNANVGSTSRGHMGAGAAIGWKF